MRAGPCGNGTGAAGVKRKKPLCCATSFPDQSRVFLSAEGCAQTHVVMRHNLFLSSRKTPGLQHAKTSQPGMTVCGGSSASRTMQLPTCPSREEMAFALSNLFG